ncbi:MAG: hypothetical protein MI806_16855 [Minwuiales bacterium]|nr:hypothetical protein [Minwuiales bacterium]
MAPKFIDCPAFLAELYTGDLTEIVPDLEINVGSPDEAAAIEMLNGCALAVNDHTYMPEALLKACPALKVIVFMGTGASSYIDVAAAERLNIGVRTIAGYGDRSVAEHAIALMFAAGRQISAMDHAVRQGVWDTLEGVEFAGKTLGVVGTGGIGREVCRLGDALGMKVIAWNRSGVPGDLPCESRELDALLAEADVVSLHLALTEETRGMIDARRFGLMKPSAILINTARGGVVDEAAMVDALKQRRIAHAGLDVFEPEPLPKDHVLTTLDNVTLTSHAAFMTKEASSRLLRMALEILREERQALGV